MTRRCSHCSHNGHNSRTCPTSGGGVVKLFGVRLNDGLMIKKSASVGNLSSLHCQSASPIHGSISPNRVHVSDGYLSDDPAHASCSTNRRGERKKGVAWTEEEHRLFLMGLQKMGKGDWRGIARNFVISRTPTQVASHAQKYFIRHSHSTRRKRRSSLFDMLPDKDMETGPVPEEKLLLPPHPHQSRETDNSNSVPFLNLSLEQSEPMEATPYQMAKEEEIVEPSSTNVPPPVHPFFQANYLSVPFPFWQLNVVPAEEEGKKEETSHHQVLKPIPVIPKELVDLDELVGMSQLNLGDTTGHHQYLQREPSPLSLKLLGASRQSAFHANAPVSKMDISDGKSSVIQAVRIREERG